MNPKLDPASSLIKTLQEGNEALAEQAAAELDAHAQAMAEGDETLARKSHSQGFVRSCFRSFRFGHELQRKRSAAPEASQELLDMMAKAAAGGPNRFKNVSKNGGTVK